jgi:hypothetical protein
MDLRIKGELLGASMGGGGETERILGGCRGSKYIIHICIETVQQSLPQIVLKVGAKRRGLSDYNTRGNLPQKAVVKNHQQRQDQDQMDSLLNSTRPFRKN